jgi:hypothetical protein
VVHACNPSYSGGRDQEDRGLKPAQANSSARPYLEKPFTKKVGLVEWLKMKALSSSPSTAKQKKKPPSGIEEYNTEMKNSLEHSRFELAEELKKKSEGSINIKHKK